LDRCSGGLKAERSYEPEHDVSKVEQHLTDYLGGYVRNNLSAREFVNGYAEWAEMAKQELDRRATRFLTALPEEELLAIANGAVSLPELLKKIG